MSATWLQEVIHGSLRCQWMLVTLTVLYPNFGMFFYCYFLLLQSYVNGDRSGFCQETTVCLLRGSCVAVCPSRIRVCTSNIDRV